MYSSVRYEVVRTESMSSSIWYEELSRRDFVSPLQSRAKGGLSSFIRYEESSRRDFTCLVQSHVLGRLVLICLVRGNKQAGLRLSGTMSHKRSACPRSSNTRNQVDRTTSVRYEVVRKVGLSCMRNLVGRTLSVFYNSRERRA